MVVASDFTKSMGLHGEPVGAIHFVCQTQDMAKKVQKELEERRDKKHKVPNVRGARIASLILNTVELKKDWVKELKEQRDRVEKVRYLLSETLEKKKRVDVKDWSFVANQRGLFTYINLPLMQSMMLKERHGIYVGQDGMLWMPSINKENVDYVATGLLDVIENFHE